MSEHREYTIAGTTYHVVGSRLYVEGEEFDDHTEVDDHPFHLFAGRPCRVEWGGSIHRSVKVTPLDWDVDTAWEHIRTEEFEPVRRLEDVKPDGIHECPECGHWAGSKDEEPKCIHCGFGYDFDVDGEEAEADG